MACFHPIHGFRGVDGIVRDNRSGAYRDLPVTIACGQCSGCRLERSRQTAARCMHEAQLHEANCFLTLTYNDQELPEDGSLVLQHWKDFAKRLRKSKGKFRYLHCGEYGDKHGRPHYHAAIFGLDFLSDRKFHKRTKNGDTLYVSPSLNKLWPMGHALIGTLTFESAAYVARYAMKKVLKDLPEELRNDQHQSVDTTTGEVTHLKPEYVTYSNRPGLGKDWLAKYLSDVYPRDYIIVNGKKCRPPKYYDKLLEEWNPRLYQKIKVLRRLAGEGHEENNTYWRLEVREAVLHAKQRSFMRDIE